MKLCQEEDNLSPVILLVIQDLPTRSLISTYFLTRGWTVLESADTDEAAFLLAKMDRDVAMLVADLILQGESGPELTNDLFGNRMEPPKVFLHDPWAYIPTHLRGAMPRDAILELPICEKKLDRFFDRRLSLRPEPTAVEKFAGIAS